MHVTLVKNHIVSQRGNYAICACEARFLCKEINNRKVKDGIKYEVLAAKVLKGIRSDLQPEVIGIFVKGRRGWYRSSWVYFIDELFAEKTSKAITITRLFLREEGSTG